jgi:hypothetical protein
MKTPNPQEQTKQTAKDILKRRGALHIIQGTNFYTEESVLSAINEAILLPVVSDESEQTKQERFKMPTDKQVVDIAILFNEGNLDTEKLADMVGMADFIIDRLYENGDVSKPSSKENNA